MKKFIVAPLIDQYKALWLNKFFVTSAIVGTVFFISSLFINFGAVKYSNREMGNPTTDILLDNIPVVNTDFIFSEGSLFFIIFVAFLFILKPRIFPFVIKSVSLFILIRSIFVMMTHLAPYPDHILTDLDTFIYISAGADLFFSGHTGIPFLMSLIFWDNKLLRWVFLLSSVVAAVAVILGHLHYTIDVFSAFFITYGIYHLSQIFFQKDYNLFLKDF